MRIASSDESASSAPGDEASGSTSASASPSSAVQHTNIPAQLVIDSRGEDVCDLVVVSFLLLEKARRAREASTGNRADVLATPLTPIGKGYALKNGGV
ncbi:hypothetical protein HGRIS_003526 [Hohenbuehelia grisea]|uniref:Uncharacterized protein n=1 Tax=Hohenbuehelia grisea TaxID=104357 RepID=A0ABR3JHB1_9AGAR